MFATMGFLMGQAEIADRLGVSRQRVQQLVARPDWPKPLITLAMGKVWSTKDIEAWIKRYRPADPGPETSDASSGDKPLGRRHKKREPPANGPQDPST